MKMIKQDIKKKSEMQVKQCWEKEIIVLNEERSQISNLYSCHKKLEKTHQDQSKASITEEIIKNRNQISGKRKMIEKISETESWLFEKTSMELK